MGSLNNRVMYVRVCHQEVVDEIAIWLLLWL